MKTVAKIVLTVIVGLTMSSATLSADAKKGQTLYLKKLKKVCDLNGAEMAEKHTVSEWEHLNTNGKIADEIKKFCPKAKDSALKGKFIPHYYDFLKMYGSDSGNIPAC